MRKRLLVIIAIVVIAAAAAVFALRNNRHQDNDIRLSGNLELTEVTIGFKTSGKLVELKVREGDAVDQGAVLARLDVDQLLRQREREQAGVRAAQSQRAQAETALEWQRASLASDIEQRRADLKQAQARLRELEAGSRPQEVEEARAAVVAARAEHERARKDWERAQVLFKNEDISASQHDQFRSRAEAAAAALRQTEQRAALVSEGPRQETIEAARAQVARAAAAVKWAEAQQLDLKRREQEIVGRRAETERARAQVALIDGQINDVVAVSPVSGVVLTKSADLGEIVAPGTTILTIGDIEHPWLRGYIGERDLGRVKIGSKVKITTDSYPGRVYWGRVSFISSEAEFTPKQIQTREERVKLVYRIKVDVENPARELKLNMPADAEIVLP